MRATARFEVRGVVQGVGFRPHVHRVARALGLDGWVGNDSGQVFVEVAGAPADVESFAAALVDAPPPLARIDEIRRSAGSAGAARGFRIVASRVVAGGRTSVPPDSAICGECLAELRDPADRRFRHPFISCTDCGPRYTIVRSLPYDRAGTTMAGFAMCARCRDEYHDPDDRRHHAQPIACHDCGPTLAFDTGAGADSVVGGAALEAARAALVAGSVVAVKALGGFQLACDATDDAPIASLRARKHRPDKPFAVMVTDVDAAVDLAHVTDAEADLLASPIRPVVLVRARRGGPLSALAAPANPLVGLLLPSTPLHHLLADDLPPLVLTSANPSGEPLVHRDDDLDRLRSLCDAVLTHDRPIHAPCDDSVVRVVGGTVLPIRRARGFVPTPVDVGGRREVLAVGGELKNTCCLTADGHAWVGPHVGDMGDLRTTRAFEDVVTHLAALHGVDPDLAVADAHPGYHTRTWAHEVFDDVMEVQHHHAHVAAVLAEHGEPPDRPVIGVAFDGTGYGLDGTVWGGELLVADARSAVRVHHLAPVPLPGGDAAIEHPARVALAHLHAAGLDWDPALPPVGAVDPAVRTALARQLASGTGCVPTTSMGRLFDAVASLLGLRHSVSFEAQAAIDLEITAATPGAVDAGHRFAIRDGVADPAPLLRGIVEDVVAGRDIADLALGFHVAVVDLVVTWCERTRAERVLDTVALTGGVFQNAHLVEGCSRALVERGFRVLTHRAVPPNDGGLSLGQAWIAVHRP